MSLAQTVAAQPASNRALLVALHGGSTRRARARGKELEGQENQHRLYQQFLVNTWEFRERIVPIRDNYRLNSETSPWSKRSSPEDWIFTIIHESGFKPDIFYWDADKVSGNEMRECRKLWPDAEITGDDWEWDLNGTFLIRASVCQFCREFDFSAKINRCTWVFEANQPGESSRIIYTAPGLEGIDLEADVDLPIERLF